MWRFIFWSCFITISLCLLALFWYPGKFNVQATPAPQQIPLKAYKSTPGLPDPNLIFDAVNKVRQADGLAPLARNSKLADVAEQRAQDMHDNRYYAHLSPAGTYFYDLFDQHSYKSGFSCENLDLEFTQAPTTYVNAWLGSNKGHRECLLDPRVTEAGYAATEIPSSSQSNPDLPSFIVVAIYAEAQK